MTIQKMEYLRLLTDHRSLKLLVPMVQEQILRHSVSADLRSTRTNKLYGKSLSALPDFLALIAQSGRAAVL